MANGNPFPEEFKESKEEAQKKHDALQLQIAEDETLCKKLQKRFNRIYFLARLLFVVLWAGLIFILWKCKLIKDVSTAIDYSQAILIIFLIFNFLTFGSITNLNAFLRSIKNKIENWIWRKNKDLVSQIAMNKQETERLKGIIDNK